MTTCVVIDAGVVFNLLVPNPQRSYIQQLFRRWSQEDCRLCAPALWLYEVTSIFTKSVQFGSLNEEEARSGLSIVYRMGVQLIEPDEDQSRRAFDWTRRLGRAAAYDSFYLAAAEQRGCDLWTADRRLVNAVNQSWTKLAAEN